MDEKNFKNIIGKRYQVANIAGVRLAVPEQTRPLHQRSVAYQGLRAVYGRRLFVTRKQRILAKVFVGHKTNLR